MRLRLNKLQANDQQAREIREEATIKEGWADVDEVLHF